MRLLGERSIVSKEGGFGGGVVHALMREETKPRMSSADRQRLDGPRIGLVMESLQLNDRLIRFDVVAVVNQDRRDLSVNRCRYPAFHLHRFDDQ